MIMEQIRFICVVAFLLAIPVSLIDATLFQPEFGLRSVVCMAVGACVACFFFNQVKQN